MIAFRPALDTDAGFLYKLHVDTMKDYVDKTWGWDEAFQESLFLRNYNPALIQIIILDGRDIGMISVEERQEDIFLRAIEIHPGYQRKGIGMTVVTGIVAEGLRKKKPVRLQVLKVNPAKGLYERLGFSVVEETPTHFIMLTSPLK